MSDQRYKWIFVREDGTTEIIIGTFFDACQAATTPDYQLCGVVRAGYAE